MRNNHTLKYILIGVFITTLGTVFAQVLLGIQIFSAIGAIISIIWDGIIFTFNIPIWLLIMIVLLSVGITSYYMRGEAEEILPHEQYQRDHISHLDWEWKWRNGGIANLIPLCPECSYQADLRLYSINPYTHDYGTRFDCGSCDFINHWEEKPHDFETRVRREIERRVRTGEYQQ